MSRCEYMNIKITINAGNGTTYAGKGTVYTGKGTIYAGKIPTDMIEVTL